jgi:hypothetical protein
VAKRPRFSRWRRLPPVFRSGEHRPIGSGNELDRIILYLPSRLLDLAEALAEKAGVAAVQDYCSRLLARALEAEQVQQKVAQVEARRGPLEGLNEIAEDADYLAEWQAQSDVKPRPAPAGAIGGYAPHASPALPHAGESITIDLVMADGDDTSREPPSERVGSDMTEDASDEDRPGLPPEPHAAVEPAPIPIPMSPKPTVRVLTDRAALEVLWRHVGRGGDESAFLPCLRRGVPVANNKMTELIRALNQLERVYRGAEMLDRRVAHALHRLALESQVLLTDAWPGVFDGRMIAAIRSVQEAVERILSDEDIRYYPDSSQP